MKYLIIIPAYNEEENIILCLESLKNQTFKDFKCIIVDDNSSDNTKINVESFIENDSRFELFSNDRNEEKFHLPGAKVVEAFNFGMKTQNIEDYDIICKFDADVIFPQNYLQKVAEIYDKNHKFGMVSGLVSIEKNGKWQFENISSKEHIRGPIKSYRKECFLRMNGLRAVLGWDNIDVMLAKMYGWEIFTVKDLWVKHLRPTAYKYKNQRAEKLGEYFYNIGLDLPLAIISSLKSSYKNHSLSEFYITIKSFLNMKHKRVLSSEEIKFIRDYRWNEILKKIR